MRGATVQLTGMNIGGFSTTSSAQGGFHFLALDPGTYVVSVSQANFATLIRQVIVATGVNLQLDFSLRVATTTEPLTVTAETPVVDTKKLGTGTLLDQDELSRMPNDRDSWALLRTIPGVLVDRVNIAGSWNDQQSIFVGKGADFADNSFMLDGTNITDDGGGSTSYFDFDAFQEISVSTGGSDLRAQTGGVNIHFTTKRGTNNLHGSARGFFTHDDLQWSNLPSFLSGDPRLQLPDGTFSDKADHIRQLSDYGAEVGGPLIKDKLWAWAAYGHQDIRVVRLNNQSQDPINTYLTNWNAKLNWQPGKKDMVSFFFFISSKDKYRLNPGYSGIATDSFLVDQTDFYPGGPRGLYKLEESHVFNANLFLNAAYSYDGLGFGYTPRGGSGQDAAIDVQQDLSYGSSPTYRSKRRWQMGDVDLRYFGGGLGGNHELRFGFGYRRTPIHSSYIYSGSKLFAYKYSPEGGVVWVYRDGLVSYLAQTWDAYLGDTYTRGRLTVNAGLRYDHQTGENLPTSAAANPLFPQLLPALNFPGGGTGVRWNDASPRVGLTYALDSQRKAVARVSYARYAGRITAFDATFDSPISGYGSYLAYNWVDLNHDGFAQPNEILINQGVQYAGGINSAQPSNPTSPNRIDPHYRARHDDEVIVGIDHELLPSLALSAAYTWRRNTDRNWQARIGLTEADYTANPPVTVTGLTAQTFSPNPAKVAAFGNGSVLTNRPDYRQTYNGAELSLAKRLSNRWMARFSFAYMDLHESFLSPAAIQNPTHKGDAPQINGGQVFVQGEAKTGGVSSRWQVGGNALYELPLGFEAAAGFWGRQGFLNPYVLNLDSGADGNVDALASPTVDDHRLPDVWDLDLRLAKTVKLHGDVALVLSADMFNVFNSGTILARSAAANSVVLGKVYGIMNPRIVRFGLRVVF